jgi:hypothetical protein
MSRTRKLGTVQRFFTHLQQRKQTSDETSE